MKETLEDCIGEPKPTRIAALLIFASVCFSAGFGTKAYFENHELRRAEADHAKEILQNREELLEKTAAYEKQLAEAEARYEKQMDDITWKVGEPIVQ